MNSPTEKLAPESCHEHLLNTVAPTLAYSPAQDFAAWRLAVAERLRWCLGPDPVKVPLDVSRDDPVVRDGYSEVKFHFSSEACARVPGHLLIPSSGIPPFPVVICLQGHTSGMHISLGRPQTPSDVRLVEDGDRDFACQAVREGYAALVIEQRCFGERKDARPATVRHIDSGCHHASMVALLLGRTMIGERVWDVSRAIDALEQFEEVDATRIGCMGNSGGGTITYFAACLDPRIAIAMPSCYVCSLKQSIARIDHCADNYIPGFLKWFELADVACLVAPRPLVVVAGAMDPIFPIEGVREAYTQIEEIYARAEATDRCKLIVGNGGHRFYAAESWPAFRQLAQW